MPDGFMQTTTSRVHDLVLTRLAKRGFDGILARDAALSDAGLTSLDMVGLMLAIESAFDIEIPGDRLTPAQFRSVAAIESLVASLRPAG